MNPSVKPILRLTNLHVRRSPTFQLHIPKVQLAAGRILCVTGPNGSGKTTLIECLAGLLQPDGGTITMAGHNITHNVRSTKTLLGFAPDDEDWFVPELCAREYFTLLQKMYSQAGVTVDMPARAGALAKRLYFTAFDQQLQHLSHGNKKKVQLIAALLHQPPLIIVDELRNGLDPLAIIAAEQLMREEATRGACIVAATHDLWWAERMADYTMLLIDGRLATCQKTKQLVTQYGSIEQLFIQTVQHRAEHHAAV